MSRIRSRMRSMLTRPSARANGPPGQEWAPRPKAMCSLALGRSSRNSAGHSNRRGSRLAAPLRSITGVPGAISTPPTDVGAPGQAEVGLDRALDAQRLLDEVGDALAVGPQLVLELGVLGRGTSGRRRAGGPSSPDRRRRETSPSARRTSRRAWSRPGRCRAPGGSTRPRAARAGGPRCTSANQSSSHPERVALDLARRRGRPGCHSARSPRGTAGDRPRARRGRRPR